MFRDDEERAEYLRDTMIMCENLCIRCARDMPKYDYIPLTSVGNPAVCSPDQWKRL